MIEKSISEKIKIKVTPQVTQESVIEFDQHNLDIFSSIVVYKDTESNDSF